MKRLGKRVLAVILALVVIGGGVPIVASAMYDETHTPGEWEIQWDSNCTQEGRRIITCTVCDEILETEAIPTIAHTPGEWEVQSPSTCTTDGFRVKRYLYCNTIIISEVIPAVHVPKPYTEYIKNVCLEPIEVALKCYRCDEIIELEILPVPSSVQAACFVISSGLCPGAGCSLISSNSLQ